MARIRPSSRILSPIILRPPFLKTAMNTLDSTPQDDRQPWTAPALTTLDLTAETETGADNFSSESSFPNDQRYAS